MNTPQVYAALRARFCAPEWAIFFEVANATGFGGSGYADAVAMNLYPSRGLEVNGFEVKVSRSDWLRELKQPAKAETIFGYCDRWWLVVGDKDIVKAGELPVNWGLIAPRAEKLAIVTQAPKLNAAAVDRPFFAALARRASRASDAEIEAIVAPRVDEELARRAPHDRHRMEEAERHLNLLKARVDAFEKATGIQLEDTWEYVRGQFGAIDAPTPAQVGEALKFLLSGGLHGFDRPLEAMQKNFQDLLGKITHARAIVAAHPQSKSAQEVAS